MCGIAGLCDYTNSSSEHILRSMTDCLVHRGPDDSGYEFIQLDKLQIGLGHRRLSIIDLSPLGHQPMSFRNFEIVYNGEIYNFQEVRRELEELGYSFSSNSDTEVILIGFHKWGMKVLEKLIGMFAFALLDKDKNKLYLVRDRIGVKPLYYYHDEDLLLFSSELKSFHFHPGFYRAIDQDGLASFLQFGYITSPNTIFRKTYKVKPGHYLEFDITNKAFKEIPYWLVENFYLSKSDKDQSQILEEIESLLHSACNYRMVADVPVGLFLSGGYDSSAVAALIQTNRTEKLKTFTIGFEDDEFNEAPFAQAVANYLGTEHTEYYCSQKDALDLVPDIPYYFDEPFADDSQIPTMLVSKLARKEVTVALSADGGDEVFGGYPKYIKALKYAKAQSRLCHVEGLTRIYEKTSNAILSSHPRFGKFQTFNNKLIELAKGADAVDFARVVTQQFEEISIPKILKHGSVNKKSLPYNLEFFRSYENLDRLVLLDFKVFLPDDLMVKVDRSTMSVSLEGREPLLDHRLIEYMGSINANSKIDFNAYNTKYYLKKIAHKHIPSRILDRPKMGFNSPVLTWLKGPLKDSLMDHLNGGSIAQQGLFFYPEIEKLTKDFFKFNHQKTSKKLWNLLMFQLWYTKWMK